jgi:hypothetical protein
VVQNTSNSITIRQNGFGTNVVWSTGDQYEIVEVLSALDQPGNGFCATDFRGAAVPAPAVWPGQMVEGVWAWENYIDGKLTGIVSSGYRSMQEERNYFNRPKPGWKPLPYPHPWVQSILAR